MKALKTAAFIGFICKLLGRPYLPQYLVAQVIGRYLKQLKRKELDFRVHLCKVIDVLHTDAHTKNGDIESKVQK